MKFNSICGLLNLIGSQFKRRKVIRVKLQRQGRLLYNISRAIGKFKMRVKRAKKRNAIFVIIRFVKIYVKRWLKR